MPFDIGDFSGASFSDRAESRRSRTLVAAWLFVVAGMLVVMIGLGGATRLTGSGLSIMEWAPVKGILPPMSDMEWQRLFQLYQQIPQHMLVNHGFHLQDFKEIFWLEWIHRLWGRLIGVAFVGPLIWLWATGRIGRRLIPRLLGILALGGLQGVVGWFMVASGFLPQTTSVSVYRLVVHLTLALLLYVAVLWTALVLLCPTGGSAVDRRPLRTAAIITGVLTAATLFAGGFVAGLHAGLDYNTFPLMDGRIVPVGYAALSPFVLNLTENIAAVQFNHRLLATLTLISAMVTTGIGLRLPVTVMPRWPTLLLGGTVAAQYALGIATLLWIVPASLGTAHQVGAVLVLTAAVVLLHRASSAPAPRPPG